MAQGLGSEKDRIRRLWRQKKTRQGLNNSEQVFLIQRLDCCCCPKLSAFLQAAEVAAEGAAILCSSLQQYRFWWRQKLTTGCTDRSELWWACCTSN